MKLVIAHLLVVVTALNVESYPYHSPYPQNQPSQYPYYVPPKPQQQPPQQQPPQQQPSANQQMQVVDPTFYAYFQQFMALFRQFLISQQNPTVPTSEPSITTPAPTPCDTRQYACVPVGQCEVEDAMKTRGYTCSKPQHVCCDN